MDIFRHNFSHSLHYFFRLHSQRLGISWSKGIYLFMVLEIHHLKKHLKINMFETNSYYVLPPKPKQFFFQSDPSLRILPPASQLNQEQSVASSQFSSLTFFLMLCGFSLATALQCMQSVSRLLSPPPPLCYLASVSPPSPPSFKSKQCSQNIFTALDQIQV